MKATAGIFLQDRLFDTALEDLSEVELLALVLAAPELSDALPLAATLLQRCGPAGELREMDSETLEKWGLDRANARGLRAAAILFSRTAKGKLRRGEPYASSRQVYDHFKSRLPALRQECFWSLLLDGKNRMIASRMISRGTLNSSLAHPREVFRPAIQVAAAAIIFVHNHPSGDPAPSLEDRRITRRLVEAGKIVGIRTLDHVIVAQEGYYSFADEGEI